MKKKYTLIHPKNSVVKSVFSLNTVLAFLFFLFGISSSFGQIVVTDNTPGGSETFTVPAGVTSITVGIWGAGGGGGGSGSNNNQGGAGGGGGGATTRVIAVTPGDVFTYTVGTGGVGGVAAAGTGGDGTGTTFVRAALGINMIANFGTGGIGNRGAGGAGGTSSGGTTNDNGLNGANGDNSGQAGGNSGIVLTIFGAGGAAITNSVGNPGNIPGGGGGGGERTGGVSLAGGAGANGQVRISYIAPPPANDLCSGATLITSNTTCTTTTGSTLGATDNNETGDCTTGVENAVWYQFQAVATTHIVTVDGIAGFDAVLQVLNTCGVAGNPTGGACVDATGDNGIETRTLTGLTIGAFYKIQIHDYEGDLMANGFTICVTHTSPPTITSLSAANGCVGSSLVITGTNLTGATAVTIGGTAATITANTATTVTVTVGAGTTGTIQVTTPGGSATSAATFTVNPLPVINTQPAITTICTTGTGTFSVVATGATTYQWRRAGAALTNVPPYSGVNTATLTITNPSLAAAGNFDVVISNGTCSVTSTARALTVTTVPSTVATPTPANAATGICYAGGGAVSSISWGAAATATSYDVYFGAGSVPGALTANVLTNTYNTGALAANTTYFWRIVAKNACGNAVTSATFTFTTASAPCALVYCASNATNTTDSAISNVTFNTINNTTSACTGYTDFRAISTTVIKSSIYNLTIAKNSCSGGTNYSGRFAAWIDWNQNGTFEAGEQVLTDATDSVGPITIAVTVPAGALSGITTMRCILREGTTAPTACGTYNWGETEDYSINVIDNTPCVTPTAQPTTLALTVSGTTINGTFTAAAPAPNNYLVIANTTGVAPTITNGTAYIIGQDLGSTNVVVDTDSNTAFSATSLAPKTIYYFFIYSMNDLCTGGPLYNTTSTLIGNATTSYCTPTGTFTVFPITNVTFAGINNSNTGPGLYYQDFTAITGNVIGGTTYNLSVTATATANPANVFYQYVFFDWNNNGDFTDVGETYLIGTYTTPTATLNTNIQIPVTAHVGTIRMRVGNSFNRILSPCATEGNYQMEDYILNITAAPPCTSPTTQPTVLVLTPGATSIAGSFTAAGAPTPQNYLVVMNTTGTAPTGLIANGTTYTIGSSIGVGNTVIDTDSNTTFTAAGLNITSSYYFYIYSMNALCTGGPLYNTSPTVLIGNATTTGTPTAPCVPTTANPNNTIKYISRVAFIGTRLDTDNISTFSTITPGYQDFTGNTKSIQAQGEGVNMIVESIGGRTRLHAWVDWNKNGTFEPSEMVYGPATAGISSTFGFVIPTGTVPGDYRVRVRTYNANSGSLEDFGLNFDACQPFSNITIGGQVYTQYGEAEDYLFTVIQRCDANIVSVTDGQVCNSGTVSLSATGTAGTTQYRWYANATGGAQLAGSPTTGSWTTPSISTTTTYYVTAWNGSCESLERKPVVANVNAVPTLTFTPSAPETCGENNIISITATGDKELSNLLFENFEGGGLGTFTNVNSDTSPGAVKNDTRWTKRASTFIPLAGISWKPAISSGLAPNNFALATSDSGTRPQTLVENSLISGVLNSTNYLNLTMTMKFYYSRYFPDGNTPTDEFVSIQISQDGGGIWTTLETFTADTGIGTKFANLSYNLNAYINQTNLRVRILHHSLGSTTGWLPDGVAVDDIKIFGEIPLGTSFQWTSVLPVDAYSDPACTTDYVSGTPAVMVYIKPTLDQLELTSYSFTASALLSNGCSASSLVTINNKSKVWKGGTNGDWNNANNWSPIGVPDATNCVIIQPAPNSSLVGGANYNGFGKTLQVIDGGNLKINPTNTLTITDFVEVRETGVFDIEDSGSLVQINNVANTGNITYKRIAPGIRGFDYVYWSSPVTGQSLAGIYTSPAQGPKYSWNTTITNGNGGQGNWVNPPATMAVGSGYIVRGSSSFGMAATAINSTFIGVPNNGTIPVTVQRGNYTGAPYPGANGIPINNLDDNYNLLGNPYPSALNGLQFLSDNSAVIEGNVKLWKHGFSPASTNANPFYASFAYNYSASDYTTINFTGPTTPLLTDIIKSGQAFFVEMKDGASGNNVVNFRNTQRSNSGTPYANDAFFRTTNAEGITSEVIERNRIWLDIVDANNIAETTLLGYITGATEAKESAFDAIASTLPMGIYSVIADETFVIQGRSLPFNNNDQVAIGFNVPNAGNYHIAINTIDGLFLDTTQNIYLEDKITNVIHNLKTSPYSFTTATGIHNERFVLRYTNQTLGTEDFTANDIKVYANESINVIATNQTIKSVRVYDLLGRILGNFNNVNATTFSTTTIVKTQTALIVEVVLENGAKQSHKVIF